MKIGITKFKLFFPAGFISGLNLPHVFLPDIHLQPDSMIDSNGSRLAKQFNTLIPDFILTGGDGFIRVKVKGNREIIEFIQAKRPNNVVEYL